MRYGWVNFAKPTLNLFNKDGLPATPFRTDDFPLTTTAERRSESTVTAKPADASFATVSLHVG